MKTRPAATGAFTIPQEWAGRQVILRFEGVDSASFVWVNGRQVGFSKGSRNTAEFDITPYVRTGRNTLAVQVMQCPTAATWKTRTCGG